MTMMITIATHLGILVIIAPFRLTVVSGGPNYGVDVSFPIHHANVSINYDYLLHNALPSLYPTPNLYRDMPIQPLGDRQATYDEFIGGCISKYDGTKCWEYEEDRIAMSLRQPMSMVNYTENGFLKTKAPDHIWALVAKFWKRNKEDWSPELWPEGNTFVNHWSSPTYMVSIDDSSLRGGGAKFKRTIFNAARASLQEWTGQELVEYSMYGIRVYTEGAMLSSHVDRLPQVMSVVLNVAQDVDEPWPIELIGHDGRAHNVTLDPGDFLLYESHSIIHGRPFPLKGRFCANLFIHLEPNGHSLKYHDHAGADPNEDINQQYRDALKSGAGGHETMVVAGELPPYILPESPEAARWRQEHDAAHTDNMQDLPLHAYAAEGRTRELVEFLEENKHLVNAKDHFGWTALHEGARSGYMDVVKYLVESGADIHERSHQGTGGNALFYVKVAHGEDHPVYKYLASLGAEAIPPEPDL